MSIRTRLTLWYVGLLALLLIVFGAVLYATVYFTSYQEVDRSLQQRATDIQASLTTVLSIQEDPWAVLRRGGLVLPTADVFATGDIYVQLSTIDGTILSRSENLGNQRLVIPQDQLDRVKNGQAVPSDFTVNRTRLRAYVAPIVTRTGQVVGFIELAQSLRQVDTTLRDLATLIIIIIATGLATAAVGGWFIAGNILEPIDRVTRTAQKITRARDLGRRIEVPTKIDEVGRLALTFNEMLSRIEDLFRAQQRFVADVSHELRSPLTAVRGNLDLLKRGAVDDPEERAQVIDAIDSETARMSRLVSDLLLLARQDSGVPMARHPIELDTLLLEVYRQAQVIAKGVKVTLGEEDQAIIVGDRDRLKQVLLNLVDNAIKYTPQGGEVTLSLVKDEEWVKIAVQDTGIGIAAENIPNLFDRFYRVDKARSRDAGGTGLGLAIAKSVVDAHNGKITVESQLGKGSTFTVWLPLPEPKAIQSATPVPTSPRLALNEQ
ncbi:MAG TPA: HAMP domain-containing sensor histidine kinase [Anaerolineae bacterium]|nr:HAMP domain-containing sensor histidine kinase [Anaerolineae bacterium]